MKTGGLEQRVHVASVQPVDQGLQVVADLQRVCGLDAGRGDPRQITVGTERATGERLEIQRGHFVDATDQFLVQIPPILGVFAHVGHAIRDAASREHVSGRRVRGNELAFQHQRRVLQGQCGSLDCVRVVGIAHQPVAIVIRQRHILNAIQRLQSVGLVLQCIDPPQTFGSSLLVLKAAQFAGKGADALR
ncbi:Uncharacterised protein [Bifidobacterium pseudocatenulatum]|uniref:Uncharacterized protein n=1 Tax=Bifidobacterium pseudocatenulatum TaxID=28026 RepID=A0AAX3IWI2_BIFPS|nr:Uncharacterised protein [Bifidobacterium pseudocatenulatum]